MNDNSKIQKPNLKEVLERKKDEAKSTLNCVLVGTIVSFDSTKQTATVSINLKKVVRTISSEEIFDYPLLVNCPVVILNGGGGYISFPVETGDSCLVLFCDRDIDNWLAYNKIDKPNSNRMHDLSDGIVLVGINTFDKAISDYNANGVQLLYESAIVALEDKIKIQVATQTLRNALDDLCDMLTNWKGVDPQGGLVAPDPTTLLAISAAKSKIDAVLK